MIIIFLGAPGSGKGTQATKIANKFHLKALSTGDLCRAEIKAASDLGLKIKEIVNTGSLVDDQTIIKLIQNSFSKYSDAKGFILDGFPRTLVQAQSLQKEMDKVGKKINFAIELTSDQDLLVERLTNRYQCKECGASYNKLFKNPVKVGVCDICGAKEFFRRPDDQEEVIRNRFEEYQQLTAPLLPYYKAQGNLHKVDGNQAPQRIYEEICNILKNVLT